MPPARARHRSARPDAPSCGRRLRRALHRRSRPGRRRRGRAPERRRSAATRPPPAPGSPAGRRRSRHGQDGADRRPPGWTARPAPGRPRAIASSDPGAGGGLGGTDRADGQRRQRGPVADPPFLEMQRDQRRPAGLRAVGGAACDGSDRRRRRGSPPGSSVIGSSVDPGLPALAQRPGDDRTAGSRRPASGSAPGGWRCPCRPTRTRAPRRRRRRARPTRSRSRPARPQPRCRSDAPARVYMQESRSGQICRLCNRMSSAVLTIAVTSVARSGYSQGRPPSGRRTAARARSLPAQVALHPEQELGAADSTGQDCDLHGCRSFQTAGAPASRCGSESGADAPLVRPRTGTAGPTGQELVAAGQVEQPGPGGEHPSCWRRGRRTGWRRRPAAATAGAAGCVSFSRAGQVGLDDPEAVEARAPAAGSGCRPRTAAGQGRTAPPRG